MSDKVDQEYPLTEPTCIHGVSWYERCMKCWPEEPEDVLPPDLRESASNGCVDDCRIRAITIDGYVYDL